MIVLGVLIALLAGVIIAGNIMEKKLSGKPDEARFAAKFKIAVFVLFLLICFFLLPVIIYYFTENLVNVISGSDFPAVLRDNNMYIVIVFWIFYFIGLFFALPAAIKDGFFEAKKDAPPTDISGREDSADM